MVDRVTREKALHGLLKQWFDVLIPAEHNFEIGASLVNHRDDVGHVVATKTSTNRRRAA